MAFAMSPECWIPPSAQMGMPCRSAASAQSKTAVICGIPAPATIRVVQIAPGPIPTLTQSAPAAISSSVPSAVATLPAMTSTRCRAFTFSTRSEEHTSELQSQFHLVCRLLLEKKKNEVETTIQYVQLQHLNFIY